jgi:hypothetical protein
MGTTLLAAQSGHLRYKWVAAVYGCEQLWTDASSSAALAAWAATEWTQALTGLRVVGRFEQNLKPWEPGVDVRPLRLVMQPDPADTLGKLAFGKQGVETRLTVALDSNDTTVQVSDTGAFAANGKIWIGTECITYTGKTATSFTGCVRGKFAPFKAGTEVNQRFGKDHRIAAVGEGATLKPRVTSALREWRGRVVGLWCHRDVAGTLDTRAQAECVWAGVIKEVTDAEDGNLYFDCDDVRTLLRDCTLMRDQYTARVIEGIYLSESTRLDAFDDKSAGINNANPLIVGATDSGTNQIAQGSYTLDTLVDKINAWLNAETAAGRLALKWHLAAQVNTTDGIRGTIRWSGGAAAGTDNAAELAAPKYVLDFLGYTADGYGNGTHSGVVHWTWANGPSYTLISPEEPFRIYIYDGAASLYVEDAKGKWFDNVPYFPSAMHVPSTLVNYGVLQLNDGPMLLFHQVSSTEFSSPTRVPFLDQLSGKPWLEAGINYRKVRVSDTGDYSVKQVAIISGPFRSVLTDILFSTGTNGYNHAVADIYPAQLGAAVPSELLSGWAASIDALDESLGAVLVVISKPTPLMDQFGADMVARTAQVVWKSGSLTCVTWGTPATALSTHSFTENNKAAPPNQEDQNRTPANRTEEYLVNQLKLAYNYVLSGGDPSFISILHPESQDESGVRMKTIELRNTFGGVHSTIDGPGGVYDLATTCTAALSLFAKPITKYHRTIALPQFLACAPGDFCTISDNFARDPTTGARRLSSLPALIVNHWFDFGGFDPGWRRRAARGDGRDRRGDPADRQHQPVLPVRRGRSHGRRRRVQRRGQGAHGGGARALAVDRGGRRNALPGRSQGPRPADRSGQPGGGAHVARHHRRAERQHDDAHHRPRALRRNEALSGDQPELSQRRRGAAVERVPGERLDAANPVDAGPVRLRQRADPGRRLDRRRKGRTAARRCSCTPTTRTVTAYPSTPAPSATSRGS